MYRIPSEFLRRTNTIFMGITVTQVMGIFGGYMIGDMILQKVVDHWIATAIPALIGFALTTFKVKGLPLYKFGQLYAGYMARYFTSNAIAPSEYEEEITSTDVALYDEQGRAILFTEVE
jgi:hypothetical protein